MSDIRNRLSRRRFLQGAGLGALAAWLSACRLSVDEPATPTGTTRVAGPGVTPTQPRASPTPSPTATPGSALQSPLQSPLATPTAAPPESTAEPTPTLTPEPAATPTPAATPFPPGPPSKLGLFVVWYHPQIMDLVATGGVAVLKTLEFDPAFLADVRARSPRTIIVGRVTLPQLNLGQVDIKVEARAAVEAILPLALDERRAGLVDAWEGHNEPVPGSEDEMRRLADLEAERVRLLAEKGLRAVVGNFGTGHPPLELWPAFRPALEAAQAHNGCLGLHEYSAPTLWFNTNREPLDPRADKADQGWLTLRYRQVYQQYLLPWGLGVPLILTECGIDGMVAGRPGPAGKGWKDFGRYWAELGMGQDAPGNYVEQLAWYDGEMRLDDYVRGGAIFAMTTGQGWSSYEIHGDAATILQQYFSVHPGR